MNSSKQIKWGAVLSYLSIAVNILAGLLYTPWMIEQIGKSQYGIYTLAHSLITLFLVDFGLSAATSRYVSKYKVEGYQEKIDNFLGAVYKLYLLVDTVIFAALLAVFFFLDKIYVNLTPSELETFKVVYAISAIFSVINFPFVTLNGILTAYEKFVQLKLADVIYRLLVVGMTVIALLNGMGIYALVTVNAIAGLAITIYKFIIIRTTTPVKVNFHYFDRKLYKDIFSFSIWVTVSTLAQRLIFNITPSILGVVANSAAIAVFGIVTTIEGYAYTITNAINGMFMPRVSRIYTQKNSQSNLVTLMIKIGKFQYVINGLLVVGFTVVGKAFIELWVGAEYMEAYIGILLVIIPGLFFNSLQIANTAMIVQNKVNIQAYITIVTGLLNICLSPLLAKKVGVIGACISIFIAYMLRAIISNIVYYKVLKIDIFLFIKRCYIGMMPPLLIAICLGLFINQFIAEAGWTSLIGEAILITIVYLILTFIVGLTSDERSRMLQFVTKKIK